MKAALWATSANVLEAGGVEAGPVEAAGRRTTIYGGGMRATSMRATSVRPARVARPIEPRGARAAGDTQSEAPASATEAVVGAVGRALSPTMVPIRAEPTAPPSAGADHDRRRLIGSISHPHLLPLDDAELDRRPLGQVLADAQALSSAVGSIT